MQTLFDFQQRFAKFLIPLALFIGTYFFIKSPFFLEHSSTLTFPVSADLLLTIPIVYFLLIRKTSIPKTTIVPIMIIGLLLGFYALPEANQQYLQLFKAWFLPVIEVGVASFIIYKVRKAVLFHKAQENKFLDFFTALKTTCAEILPKPVVIPFATEISIFYYGIFYWKRRKLAKNEFSNHKESGSLALLFVLIFLIAIEIVPVHILLAKWSDVAAWILTILSAYSGLQIFGYAKSLMKRPIAIEENRLLLRYGIMQEAEIPLEDIKEITLSSKELDKEENIVKLALLGEMESHNVIIETNSEHTLRGLFGIQKTFTKIALHVDTPVDFKKYINDLTE
ncbi:hypothetical protein [uncultured Kordia sp.]|uniref:hypothetical protein n=1 Tax=uncultured Kordia sp. TaxID=507699 RepID=UPI0026261E9D|nr:hypothetical protein [uncultured Kordia sp.]